MKMSTFLKFKMLLPFAAIGLVFLSLYLVRNMQESYPQALAFIPGVAGAILLVWFYYSYGYCPGCGKHMGKNIGFSCKHCDHKYKKNDLVNKGSR